MTIRVATEHDIPTLVELLKESLGESLMPKSEAYWLWKHVANPFGPSPVLVCEEGGQLIGVRAFMRWNWQYNGQVYRAVRAVDTATHPGHQGKGIFKKLTLALLEQCRADGDDFVFNTPNAKSRPGYLKMGWEQAGKLPIRMTVHRPLKMVIKAVRNAPLAEDTVIPSSVVGSLMRHPSLEALLARHQAQADRLTTAVTPEYLRWRYVTVPVASYVAIAEEQHDQLTSLLVARIKQTRLGRELRITDCFVSTFASGKALMKQLKDLRRELNADYSTVSGTIPPHALRLFDGMSTLPDLSVGPIVTVRSLAPGNFHFVQGFDHWSPTLGDLELF